MGNFTHVLDTAAGYLPSIDCLKQYDQKEPADAQARQSMQLLFSSVAESA